MTTALLYSVLNDLLVIFCLLTWLCLSYPLSQGPFVHVASLCAALLSKFMAAVFGGIYMVRIETAMKPLKTVSSCPKHTTEYYIKATRSTLYCDTNLTVLWDIEYLSWTGLTEVKVKCWPPLTWDITGLLNVFSGQISTAPSSQSSPPARAEEERLQCYEEENTTAQIERLNIIVQCYFSQRLCFVCWCSVCIMSWIYSRKWTQKVTRSLSLVELIHISLSVCVFHSNWWRKSPLRGTR